MRYSREEQANSFVDSALARGRCEWCRSPWRSLYRVGLCRSCYNSRSELKNIERRITRLKTNSRPVPGLLIFEQRVLKRAVANCKTDGDVLDDTLMPGSSAVDLEHDLDWLSQRICHRKLFHGLATELGWVFGPEHIRFLRCLIWKIISAEMSRHRVMRAQSDLVLGDRWE